MDVELADLPLPLGHVRGGEVRRQCLLALPDLEQTKLARHRRVRRDEALDALGLGARGLAERQGERQRVVELLRGEGDGSGDDEHVERF